MTTQISDTLIYNGENHSLYVELLFHHLRERDIKPKSDGSFSALWERICRYFRNKRI
jgi:hypothetical protein